MHKGVARIFIKLDPLEGKRQADITEQHGIERNFGFLKDPLIVNDLFLKKPERIEVLGLILLISLLIWNLMEHVVRGYLSQT